MIYVTKSLDKLMECVFQSEGWKHILVKVIDPLTANVELEVAKKKGVKVINLDETRETEIKHGDIIYYITENKALKIEYYTHFY